MPIRPILEFPDPGLARPADAVRQFDADLRSLADDLLETMHAAPGIGITAPHVGVPLRLVVIDLPPGGPRFYVNPEVIEASTDTEENTEGSVSMPGAFAEVRRPASVRVAYRDLDGHPNEARFEGFLAAVIQHEIDQLDGVFFLDRLSRLKRERLVKRWQKAARG